MTKIYKENICMYVPTYNNIEFFNVQQQNALD